MRFFTRVSIFAILESALINSLPQNSVQSEATDLVSIGSDQDTSYTVEQNSIDASDDHFNDPFSTLAEADVGSTLDPSNLDKNEPIIAVNTGNTGSPCQSESDPTNGVLSGRDSSPNSICGVRHHSVTSPDMMSGDRSADIEKLQRMLQAGKDEDMKLVELCVKISIND